MLESLKRLFGRNGSTGTPVQTWPDLSDWAEGRQFQLRPVKGGEGFVIEGRLAAQPWRLEWGPSQRPYIRGFELRVRAETGMSPDIEVMILDRALQAAMEKSVFDQYVESVQTRIDNQTPPEMRWLVMFQKVSASEMGPLKDRFAAVSSVKHWPARWLEGPLAAALADAPLSEGQPLVLMIGRGRLSLRTALGDPTPAQVKAWVSVFETAMREARRVGNVAGEAAAPSTQPSLWSPSDIAAQEQTRRS